MSTKTLEVYSLGPKIKTARRKANLTQEDLAEIIDTTRRQLIKYEKDEVSPTVETLLKIANACQINPQELLPEENLIPAQK